MTELTQDERRRFSEIERRLAADEARTQRAQVATPPWVHTRRTAQIVLLAGAGATALGIVWPAALLSVGFAAFLTGIFMLQGHNLPRSRRPRRR